MNRLYNIYYCNKLIIIIIVLNYYNYYSKYVFSRFNDYDYIVINHISADILHLSPKTDGTWKLLRNPIRSMFHISLCDEGREMLYDNSQVICRGWTRSGGRVGAVDGKVQGNTCARCK